jgi:ABC-type multidrug transport system ATPase subunit
MIVIASIHQPSTSTLLLFDNVLLLSQGKTVYYGPPNMSTQYFTALGHPPQPFMSPAESMLDLTNVDFARDENQDNRLAGLVTSWEESRELQLLKENIERGEKNAEIFALAEPLVYGYPRNLFMQTWIQFHRMALVCSPLFVFFLTMVESVS